MAPFLVSFALSFSATLLLVSGLFHAARPRRFANTLRSQGFFKGFSIYVIVVGVSALELSVGGVSSYFLLLVRGRAGETLGLATAVCLGLVFAAYLRHLISTGRRDVSCGCSPLSAPLTRASL